jgi:hypothetical protein
MCTVGATDKGIEWMCTVGATDKGIGKYFQQNTRLVGLHDLVLLEVIMAVVGIVKSFLNDQEGMILWEG